MQERPSQRVEPRRMSRRNPLPSWPSGARGDRSDLLRVAATTRERIGRKNFLARLQTLASSTGRTHRPSQDEEEDLAAAQDDQGRLYPEIEAFLARVPRLGTRSSCLNRSADPRVLQAAKEPTPLQPGARSTPCAGGALPSRSRETCDAGGLSSRRNDRARGRRTNRTPDHVIVRT
jgi:hypothetical protein